jgi:hypothetical protein
MHHTSYCRLYCYNNNKNVEYWLKNGNIYHWKDTKESRISLTQRQLTNTFRHAKNSHRGKMISSMAGVRKTGYTHAEKYIGPLSYIIHINLK